MAPRKRATPIVTPDADTAEAVLDQLDAKQVAESVPAVLATSSAFDKRTIIFASLLGGAGMHGALEDAVIESRMTKLLRITDIAVKLLEKADV